MPAVSVQAGNTIFVKVVTDEEEVTRPEIWQQRLAARISNASDIIGQYTNLRFQVQEFGTWRSDNRINDLSQSLRELEQEVSPEPAQIVIAFSSQYKFVRGRNGLGGTRGPLHSHILLRESAPKVFENERLEALVHEMGHFLGASHSGQLASCMRPVVGDGQARATTFRIGFDKHNARVIRLVGREVELFRVRKFRDLSQPTKVKLKAEYEALRKELPNDPASPRFLELLTRPSSRRSPALPFAPQPQPQRKPSR